ncbi:GGDEF domain-containing protein [Rugamonas apoptosis]|uniref:diguanylate cyclase n=1 Tax=Rugamonas apoptosis TaxID=2758570 RepID=A0A7W2FA29_9BURK|nr:GGDEF domain-containing protein [Rugamonas apoptosis]MBA5687906.1 GGDEF domain-containing protein [Rugamonas apoptosis]
MLTLKSEHPVPSVLKQLGEMTACRDMHLVEQSLLRTLGPVLGIKSTSLYRVDEHGVVTRALHHTRDAAMVGGERYRTCDQTGEPGSAVGLEPAVADLLSALRLLDHSCARPQPGGYLIGYPLHGADHLCGYVVFERDHEVTPTEHAVIHGVLEVFSNYYALLDASQRDRLTGLLNRHSLELNLTRMWDALAQRLKHGAEAAQVNRRRDQAQTYWLGVLDIDHFKKVNDTHGHIMGDEILLLTARLLEGALRRSDLLYRYGGEEFIVIVAANDLATATQIFERARQAVAQFKFPQVGRLSISGGFSMADPAVQPQAIINRADRALYEAKADGRDRIYFYEELIRTGRLQEVQSGTIDLF